MNKPRLIATASLKDVIGECFIIAHHESTSQLENVLRCEGLTFSVLRQTDQPSYQNYASIYLCMLNHKKAWERAALLEKPTLIVEDDFVPVKAFSRYPCPFDPDCKDLGIAWLYTTAPKLYELHKMKYAIGYSSSLVSYVISSKAAHCLCEYADYVSKNIGTGYSNFDRYIGDYLYKRSFVNFIPYRNYGEHGGLPNPEHRLHGQKSVHHADVLFGKLAFYPLYAGNGWLKNIAFLGGRLYGRVKGLGRLITGLYLPYSNIHRTGMSFRMLRFAAGRHFVKRF